MSQVNDYIITPTTITMSTLATELQEMFAAAASCNRGSTAPLAPFEGMLWWDSSANPEVLKRYTVAGGWSTILSVNITTGAMTISGYVLSSLYNAHTILAATSDNTPAAVTVAEDRILGRKAGGNITALTGAEVSTIIGGGSVLPWLLYTDVKLPGVDGGSAVASQWTIRTLNTETGSSGYGDWSTLTSNKFQLSTGTYFIEASAPAYDVTTHQLALYNYTSSTFVLMGTAERAYGAGATTRSIVKGLFTVTSASHWYVLIHYAKANKANNGLGIASDSTKDEIYTVCHIVKHS